MSRKSQDNDIFNTSGGDGGRAKLRSEVQKENYANDLYEQIREKERAKELERQKKELYDKRLEREMMTYDPFGKGIKLPKVIFQKIKKNLNFI